MTEYFNEWGQEPLREPDDVADPDETALVFTSDGQVLGAKNMRLTPLTEEDIARALARTEVVETEQGDLLVAPGRAYFIGKDSDPLIPMWGGSIEMEVELPEDQFWRVVEALLGSEAAREMKQDLEDILRWEGEGGPCMVG